jgi:hypothetical protein
MFNINTSRDKDRIYSAKGIIFGAEEPLKGGDVTIGKYRKVKAQGSLTVAIQPSNGDTFTIGSKTYTLQTTLTNVDGNIQIGASLAATQANIVAAINLTGNVGTQYAAATRVNTQVTAGTFATNVSIITAKEAGTAGNSIATTETFASGSNIFNAATLGTTRAGADYSNPDVSYVPFMQYYVNGGGSSWGAAVRDVNNLNRNYATNRNSILNINWLASAMYKINVPAFSPSKIKMVDTLGMCIASQLRVELSSAIGASTSTEIYKIIDMGSSKGVALFYNGTDSRIYVVAFTIASSGLLTVGTPVTVNNTNCTIAECDIVKIATDKFLVGYKDSLATNFPKTAVGSISTLTISIATGVQIVATANTSFRLVQVDTDKAVAALNADSMYVVSVTGTTPSYGTLQTLTGASGITMCQNGTGKFQLAYTLSSVNTVGAATVSGTVITFGTAFTVTSGNHAAGVNTRHKLVQITTDKIFYATDSYDDMYTPRSNLYLFTISGTTTTLAHAIASGRDADEDVEAELIDTNKVMLVRNYLYSTVIDIDSTNNLIIPRVHDMGSSGGNYFPSTEQNRTLFTYTGTGNKRFAKVGNHVIVIDRQPASRNKLQYYSFPVSLSIEVYKDDEYVKTVVFDTPAMYDTLNVELDIDDYEANIKLKNPNAQLMYLLPEARGYKSSVVID